jgi:hypothetical protein
MPKFGLMAVLASRLAHRNAPQTLTTLDVFPSCAEYSPLKLDRFRSDEPTAPPVVSKAGSLYSDTSEHYDLPTPGEGSKVERPRRSNTIVISVDIPRPTYKNPT